MNEEKLLNKNEVAELLQCSVRQVDVLRVRDGLPSFIVGYRVRFRLEEIMNWLQKFTK